MAREAPQMTSSSDAASQATGNVSATIAMPPCAAAMTMIWKRSLFMSVLLRAWSCADRPTKRENAEATAEGSEFTIMAPNSEPNLDPESAFWALFKQHWKEGAGRPAGADPRHKGWTDREFLDAMQKCGHQISDD